MLLMLCASSQHAEAQSVDINDAVNSTSKSPSVECSSPEISGNGQSRAAGSKGLMRGTAAQQVASATHPEIQEAASSILRMVSDIARRGEVVVVKVPAYNFLGILQELQNRKARFLMPDSKIPAYARAFRLESEQAGLSQLVYLPN